MVNLNIAPESEPSFDIGGQGYLVREIELRLQIERTAIDKVVAVMGVEPSESVFLPQFTVSYPASADMPPQRWNVIE